MPDTKKGSWKLQEVRDQVLQNCWSYQIVGQDAGLLNFVGQNTSGVYGDNTTVVKSSFIQIPGAWKSMAIGQGPGGFGGAHAGGIKDDNTLWMWGVNCQGGLGTNDTVDYSSPVQIPGTTWCSVNTGRCGTVALKTNGTMWAWGLNNAGQLGLNNTTCYSSPVQIPGTTWCCAIIKGGRLQALKTDGTLWGVGSGAYIGTNNTTCYSSPVQIPGTTWCKLSLGSGTTFAVKTNNTFWVWGSNGNGAAGQDTCPNVVGNYSSPIQIPGTTWCDAAGLYNAGGGIKTDGTMWSWGYNNQNQLATSNSNSTISSPAQIPGTTWCYLCSAQSVQGGGPAIFGMKTDGTLWSWGAGYNGQMGIPSITGYSGSPNLVPGNWVCAINNNETSAFLRKL